MVELTVSFIKDGKKEKSGLTVAERDGKVFVTAIETDSLADGVLNVNDQIIKVQNKAVWQKNMVELAVDNAAARVTFQVIRSQTVTTRQVSPDFSIVSLNVQKPHGELLGLGIASTVLDRAFVTDFRDGSEAQKKFKHFDTILTVNDKKVQNKDHCKKMINDSFGRFLCEVLRMSDEARAKLKAAWDAGHKTMPTFPDINAQTTSSETPKTEQQSSPQEKSLPKRDSAQNATPAKASSTPSKPNDAETNKNQKEARKKVTIKG